MKLPKFRGVEIYKQKKRT